MSATIHQIKYDLERGTDAEERAYQIRNADMYDIDPDDITAEDLDALYNHVGHDEDATLDTVFHRWNNGSGQESAAFRRAECRSLSPGDIVILDDGSAHLVCAFGFERLETLENQLPDR